MITRYFDPWGEGLAANMFRMCAAYAFETRV